MNAETSGGGGPKTRNDGKAVGGLLIRKCRDRDRGIGKRWGEWMEERTSLKKAMQEKGELGLGVLETIIQPHFTTVTRCQDRTP